jgi:hypothetical protein
LLRTVIKLAGVADLRTFGNLHKVGAAPNVRKKLFALGCGYY